MLPRCPIISATAGTLHSQTCSTVFAFFSKDDSAQGNAAQTMVAESLWLLSCLVTRVHQFAFSGADIAVNFLLISETSIMGGNMLLLFHTMEWMATNYGRRFGPV